MKATKLRVIVAAVVFVVMAAGLIAHVSLGTLSGFGWDTIAMLCPLGALTSMIAAKTLVPRAIVALVIVAVVVFLAGRVFCGWVCPVPLIGRIREFFRSPRARKKVEQKRHEEVIHIAQEELDALKKGGCSHDCSSCASVRDTAREKFDSRHFALGGALLSAAVFGFPVFCLICPIGLSFATVLVIWRLFAAGDMTLLVVIIPLMLIVELVFLRKWCTRFCPLAGLMNLISRFGRTWRPAIDDSKCIETTKGVACSRCAEVCEADINLRHLASGERGLADCTRCRACVEACPAHAISMPFSAKGMAAASLKGGDGGADAGGVSAAKAEAVAAAPVSGSEASKNPAEEASRDSEAKA